MRDHLSLQTTHFWQKDLYFTITEPHQRSPVLADHIFVASEVVFQERFYCIMMMDCTLFIYICRYRQILHGMSILPYDSVFIREVSFGEREHLMYSRYLLPR